MNFVVPSDSCWRASRVSLMKRSLKGARYSLSDVRVLGAVNDSKGCNFIIATIAHKLNRYVFAHHVYARIVAEVAAAVAGKVVACR